MVTDLLLTAFNLASAAHHDIHQRWISLSFRAAAVRTTAAMIVPLQRLGRMDMVLRSMEEERAARVATNAEERIGELDIQTLLSEAWVMLAYELVRSYREATRRHQGDEPVAELLRLLELIRMPIAKQQIAKDRSMRAPVTYQVSGLGGPTTSRTYDPSDPRRSEIITIGVMRQTGSVVWWPTDLTQGGVRQIERRRLGDLFLDAFDPPTAPEQAG